MDRKEIEKQAKKIMDSFARALDKSGVKEKTIFVERNEDRRVAKDEKGDSDFRKIMFENAPLKKGDFLMGEKGGWEE